MMGAKKFLGLVIPLTFSIYLLMFQLWVGFSIVPWWIPTVIIVVVIPSAVLIILRVGEKEEEELLSDQMHIH